ncbi:FecR family protein [Roseiterribacter gracilis]|uniref:FecR protein domain-containing protein n=1 Tax=Roseiterribacter gracilis TaxID=2812848 RepID=A0A8S8XDR9_9PROT|nr:hypothetical protein TMPK1_16620 [Rhodospirillales bacterium TMPK1]
MPRLHVALALAAVAFLLTPSAHAAVAGTVTKLQGDAARVADGKRNSLDVGEALSVGDVIETGAKSRLLIKLVDGSELTLGENARATLDALKIDKVASSGEEKISVEQGAFLFQGGSIEKMKQRDVAVRTPVATMGIRGTKFWGGQQGDRYGVLTFSGKVEVKGKDGSAVLLTAGKGTWFGPGATTPKKPDAWTKQETSGAVESITFSPK